MNPQYPKGIDPKHRERLGMVFTEEAVAAFIVDRAFAYLNTDAVGRPLHIIEPSVGGGSFYGTLMRKIAEKIPDTKGRSVAWKHVYATDIEPLAVQLAIQNAEQIQSQFEPKATVDFSQNIRCRDFLSSEPADFGLGKKCAGADLVIGNPPYIGEKGNKELFQSVRSTDFGTTYYEKGMDYFYYFIEKGLELLANEGVLAYITTSYWTRADSAAKLREAIRRQAGFVEVIDFKNARPFKEASGQNNMIFILKKGYEGTFPHYTIQAGRKELPQAMDEIRRLSEDTKEIKTQSLRVRRTDCTNKTTKYFAPYFFFLPDVRAASLRRIEEASSHRLADLAKINQGIVSGADKVTANNYKYLSPAIVESESIQLGDGIFVLSKSERERLVRKIGASEECIVPFYKNSSIGRYHIEANTQFLLYIEREAAAFSPLVQAHLYKFRDILERRREVRNGSLPYYALHWSRERQMFEGEKIVVPQRAYRPVFAYSGASFYASADVYFIHQMKTDVHFLLAYLNSSLVEQYLRYMGKRKGSYYELYRQPLSEIPIWDFSEEVIEALSDRAKIAMSTPMETFRQQAMDEIDEIIEATTGIVPSSV